MRRAWLHFSTLYIYCKFISYFEELWLSTIFQTFITLLSVRGPDLEGKEPVAEQGNENLEVAILSRCIKPSVSITFDDARGVTESSPTVFTSQKNNCKGKMDPQKFTFHLF